MIKRKINQYWLDLLTTSYLILTLILGLYSLFHLTFPATAIIFFCEIAYLIVGLILTAVILIQINLFLARIKRTNFRLTPIKIQLHNVTLWAIVVWIALILIYGIHSAWTLFSDLPLILPSFLGRDIFNSLLTLQFSLTIYLLLAMIAIFIYALVLHRRKEIKIIPDGFWAFEVAQFHDITSFHQSSQTLFLLFLRYFALNLYQVRSYLIVLALKLNHLKALALRQFKKETTPPSLFYSHSI